MTLQSSLVIFQAFAASMTSTAQTTSVASMTASFHQKITDPDG